MNSIRRVARNISYLFAYQVVSRVLGLALNLVLARRLNDIGFGRYSLIIVIVTMVSLAADFGTANITIREISRDRRRANKYLTAALLLRLGTTVLVAGLTAIIAIGAGAAHDFALPLIIASLSIIPTSMSTAVEASFQAFERMDLSALADVVFSIALTGAGITVVRAGGGVAAMATVYLVASAVRMFYSFFVYRFVLGIRGGWGYDGAIFRHLVKESFPVLYWQVISLAYYKVDMVLLGALRTEAEVGWYAAAYKMFEVVIMFGWLAMQALLPMMSRFYHTSKEKLYIIFEKVMKYVWIGGLGAALLFMALAQPVVTLLLPPDFQPAINLLKVLGLAIPLMVGCTLFGNLYVAMNLQGRMAKWSVLSLLVNIGLNLALIPRYGPMGSAMATLFAEMFTFVLFYFFTAYFLRHVGLVEVFVFPAIAAGALMALLSLVSLPSYAAVAAAVLGYPVLLFVLRAVSADDISYFRRLKEG